ncbi:hypothetical protein SAMN05216241_1132 [Limimonas halophila]|uniref:DUF6455 domain-containing protein n=1 Tax=Limimonas halophila TaxID=1082479 RepID=A0A1G7U9L5_9PROT|nr:DUF6455 family protein [Limimonas halophila]SDG43971.1 hypothetical protein SAMN05216241_1132 [Limimonas halophila]
MAALSPDWITRGASRLRGMVRDTVLDAPLGRTPDRTIDAALVVRGITRAELFTPGTAVARHRERLARMVAEHGLSPAEVVATHWDHLKEADQVCAVCANKARCAAWLDGKGGDDSPRKFCPNALVLERIKGRLSGW